MIVLQYFPSWEVEKKQKKPRLEAEKSSEEGRNLILQIDVSYNSSSWQLQHLTWNNKLKKIYIIKGVILCLSWVIYSKDGKQEE